MKKQFNTALRLSALSIALLAAGCGGGSNSNNDSGTSTRSVSGTAAKGIIKGGLVQVFALNAQGQKSASPIATTKTDNDGTFSVTIPNNLLLFVVEVSATTGATMADEATGQDIAVPANMVMRNVVTLAEGAESYSGSVTPLTELAVKTAEKSTGGLTASNIARAKAGVRNAFGFDPETVKPINANSPLAAQASEQQKTQALVLAAISKMAKDGALGCAPADVKCVVEAVASSGTLSGGGMTLGEIGRKLETATHEVASDDSINKTGKKTVELPPAIKDPVVTDPVTPAPETAVQAAKKLFSSLRTNLNAIADSSTALEARAELVNADFDKMVAPIDQDLAYWINVPTFAIDYFADYKAGNVTNPIVPVSSSAPNSDCRIWSNAAFTVAATSAEDALNITCVINRKVVSLVNSGTTITRKDVVQTIAITPSTGNTHQYTARSRLETRVDGVRNPLNDQVIGNYGNTNNFAVGTITYDAGTDRANFAIKGQMPARTSDSGAKLTDYEQLDLTATRSSDSTAQTTTYDVSAAITSHLNNAQIGKISVNPGSRLRLATSTPGSIAVGDIQEFNLSITGESGASAITGALSLTGWKNDKQSALYAPTLAVFSGSLTQGGKPFFSGELKYQNAGFGQFDSTLPITAQNYLTQTATLRGEIAIPQRPALKLFLSATSAALDSQVVSGQYDDGSSVINFNVENTSSVGGTNRTASISSASGVSFSFTEQDLNKADPSVAVLKDSAKVALINLKTGVISYTDGTFESLK
jgi:hypothetical protein